MKIYLIVALLSLQPETSFSVDEERCQYTQLDACHSSRSKVASAGWLWNRQERKFTTRTKPLTAVRQTSTTLGTTTRSTASSTLSHKTTKLHTISHAHTILQDTSTAKMESTINVSITTESDVTTRDLKNATKQPLFTTPPGTVTCNFLSVYNCSGDDYLPAVVVAAVLVTITVTASILVLNREVVRKKWNLLLATSLDNYKTQTFHNAAYKEAEAVPTECGYDNLPPDNANPVATNDANSEYHYVDCVHKEKTTRITDNNYRATTDDKYKQQGLHALPVLGNIYAHLNDSKISQTGNEYAHTNTLAVGNQAREAQEYAFAACYHTSITSKIQSKTKNGTNTMNESSLNEQDSLYSHASTNKEKNVRKTENTDTYSHIQVVSTSSGNETQTLKEIEKVYKKTNFHSDNENEGEYDEPQHEYFVLEPMSGQRKEQENKSLDMGTRNK